MRSSGSTIHRQRFNLIFIAGNYGGVAKTLTNNYNDEMSKLDEWRKRFLKDNTAAISPQIKFSQTSHVGMQ